MSVSPSVPILIEFADIKYGSDRIIRTLHGAVVAPFEGVSLPQLLSEGMVTVLIDDVVFSDAKRMGILRAFISEYPKNRFIFSTAKDASYGMGMLGEGIVVDADTPIAFSTILLKPFTRRKMRSLVEKWDRDGRLDRTKVLNKLLRDFADINVPVTAANGTILLSIMEQPNGAGPINRASLIECFVEHLLEKRSPDGARRKTFDFTNKSHVLASLAAYMAKHDAYVIDRDAAVKVIGEYIDELGFAQNPDDLVDVFTASRILVRRSENRISFKYRAFLEYFIALQMGIDGAFKSWVLADERYLSYLGELQCYAGLVRNDAVLLETVADRFDRIYEEMVNGNPWMADLSKVHSFSLPSSTSKEDLFSEFERQMSAPPLTQEEKDEMLEAEMPRDAELRQEVFRPVMRDLGDRWTTSLMLYSGILKNMEIIPDAVKRRHLANVLRGWGTLTVQSLYLVPLLAKHRTMKVNGIQYEVWMPKKMPEAEVARNIYVSLPNGISRMLLPVLGTEKLQRQLTEPKLDDAREEAIIGYYRAMLIADLMLPRWYNALQRLSEQLKDSTYLSESMLRRVSDIFMLDNLNRDEDSELRKIIGDTIGKLRGGDHAERQRVKGRAMQRISRQAMIRQLRMAASDARADTEEAAAENLSAG